MDPGAAPSFTAAVIPALVSTGITVLYLFLKFITYITNATSCAPEKQEAAGADRQTGYTQQSGGQRRQSLCEVHEQTQEHSCERRNGARWPTTTTPRTLLLSGKREDVFLSSKPYGEWDHELPALQTDDGRLCKRGNPGTTSRNGKRPPGPHHDPRRIFTTSEGRTNTDNGQSQSNPGISREEQEYATRSTAGHNSVGIPRFREASTNTSTRPVKQTVEAAAQTDSTEAFVVSKDTLVAYTIAIIQQTNDYHFGQMSVVYQTAHNKTALETPSRAEELAKDHFNIALLTDKIPEVSRTNEQTDTSPPTVDPTSKASTQETIPKSVDKCVNHPNTKPPTGTVPPTSRSQSELCNGIPAGDESDDSWGYFSSNPRTEDQTPDLEDELMPILTLRAWQSPPQRATLRGRPRGRGGRGQHRQHNQNIPVRDGYEQPPRPWESRPYGRRTRSQRALQERAYRKWARRYQVQ